MMAKIIINVLAQHRLRQNTYYYHSDNVAK